MKTNWPLFASAIVISAAIMISSHLSPSQSPPITPSKFAKRVKSMIAASAGADVKVNIAPYRNIDDVYIVALNRTDEQGRSLSTRVRFSHNGVGEYAGKVMGEFLGKPEDMTLLIDSVAF